MHQAPWILLLCVAMWEGIKDGERKGKKRYDVHFTLFNS